nr:nickel insertion protein [Natrinema altunense]
MRTLVFDGRMGASGDMILATLLDAGADPAALEPAVERDALAILERAEAAVERGPRYPSRSAVEKAISRWGGSSAEEESDQIGNRGRRLGVRVGRRVDDLVDGLVDRPVVGDLVVAIGFLTVVGVVVFAVLAIAVLAIVVIGEVTGSRRAGERIGGRVDRVVARLTAGVDAD